MGTPVDREEVFTGAGSRTISLEGRFIRVLECDASGVTITPKPGSPLLRNVGQDIDAGTPGFKSFQIAVTVACTVKVCVSDTRQSDTNTNVTANVTATISPGGTFPAGGDVACPNAAETELIAGAATGLTVIVRSSAANAYAVGTVRVGGTGVTAAKGIELNPGESISLDTTAPVHAYNASGAGVTLQVLPVQK